MEYIGKHVRITQATEEDLDFLCRLECDPSIWVYEMCNAQNKRSALLMEKVGMKREGIFREELFWNDQYVDQYFFSILKSEFFADTGVEGV